MNRGHYSSRHCSHDGQTTAQIESSIEDYKRFSGRQVVIMTTSHHHTECENRNAPFSGHFDPDELYRTVQNLQNQGYSVRLDGVEPLLDPWHLKSFKLAGQKTAMTDGQVLTENSHYIFSIREAGIDTINILYHFDLQKDLSGVSPCLVKAALRIVDLEGLKSSIVTTITRPYLREIPKYCEWCVKQGITEIHFMNYLPQGKANDNWVLTPDDRKRYYDIISEQRRKYSAGSLRISSSCSFGACESSNITCRAAYESVVLTPEYKVYPCPFMMKPGKECGFYKDGFVFIKKNLVFPRHDCAALDS